MPIAASSSAERAKSERSTALKRGPATVAPSTSRIPRTGSSGRFASTRQMRSRIAGATDAASPSTRATSHISLKGNWRCG
jgi:hypothetical protein